MPVGRVAGVTIRLHVTFLALLALVAVSAADAGESVVAEVGWLVLLFTCVVAHELAHSVVARGRGIAVQEIDLLPIGGVSQLERIPERWQDETAIAAAGPAASVAVAAGLFALAGAGGLTLLPPSLVSGPLLTRLAWVNLVLAGFNLLPAFPLDGGRVLRAQLERHRSRADATQRAARVSRVLAFALIGLGAVVNLWLLFIGFFVLLAGRAEEVAVLVHEALGPAPASTVAMPCPVVLRVGMSVDGARELARSYPQAAYPLADADGTFVGIVTSRALWVAASHESLTSLASTATVDVGASLEDAVASIGDGAVAVTDRGRLVGVITADVLDEYLRRRLREVTAT